MRVPCQEHEAAIGVPDVRQAGFRVKVLTFPIGLKMADRRTVELAVRECALGPVPSGIFLGAEGEDCRGGFEPEGVDEVEGELLGVELKASFLGFLDRCIQWPPNNCSELCEG